MYQRPAKVHSIRRHFDFTGVRGLPSFPLLRWLVCLTGLKNYFWTSDSHESNRRTVNQSLATIKITQERVQYIRPIYARFGHLKMTPIVSCPGRLTSAIKKAEILLW